MALVFLLLTVGTSLVRSTAQVDWNSWLIYVKYVSELIILAVPLWFIFRGRNWARWLLVAYGVGGFCVSIPQLIQHFDGHSSRWLVSYGLRNLIVVVALVALFLPSSSQWFRGRADARTT
jgi:hypothetical protein